VRACVRACMRVCVHMYVCVCDRERKEDERSTQNIWSIFFKYTDVIITISLIHIHVFTIVPKMVSGCFPIYNFCRSRRDVYGMFYVNRCILEVKSLK